VGSVKDFFDGLPARVEPAKIAGVDNTYIFDIAGAGVWTVALRNGRMDVTEGDAGNGDVTISSSAENFERIVSGKQNPTSAYMTGKIKVKGDMGAAMKLQKLF
jgi:putative sterol carrier protein